MGPQGPGAKGQHADRCQQRNRGLPPTTPEQRGEKRRFLGRGRRSRLGLPPLSEPGGRRGPIAGGAGGAVRGEAVWGALGDQDWSHGASSPARPGHHTGHRSGAPHLGIALGHQPLGRGADKRSWVGGMADTQPGQPQPRLTSPATRSNRALNCCSSSVSWSRGAGFGGWKGTRGAALEPHKDHCY